MKKKIRFIILGIFLVGLCVSFLAVNKELQGNFFKVIKVPIEIIKAPAISNKNFKKNVQRLDCIDSDLGRNPLDSKGHISTTLATGDDFCRNLDTVVEFSCNVGSSTFNIRDIVCPEGTACLNGACVQKIMKYVSVNGNDNNNGSRNSPYRTIQYAINQAPADGIIRVGAGDYREIISINKKLRLVGEDPLTTFISKNTTDATIVNIDSANDVWIENFGISGFELNCYENGCAQRNANMPNGFGLFSRHSNVTLINVDVDHVGHALIFAENSNFLVQDIKVSHEPTRLGLLGHWLGPSHGAIEIFDSSGTIDRFENSHGVDHIITFNISSNRDHYLNIRNSTIRGQTSNWGNGIQSNGGPNANIEIINNHLIGPVGSDLQREHPESVTAVFPQSINFDIPLIGANESGTAFWPIGVTLGSGHYVFEHNIIEGFPIGVDVGALPNTTHISASNNIIRNNAVGLHVDMTSRGPNNTIDFGGGSLGSVGNNIIENNTLTNAYARDWVRGRGGSIAFCKNNWWGSSNMDDVNRIILDSHDDNRLGQVEIEPILNNRPQ